MTDPAVRDAHVAENRLHQLEARTYHIDGEVAALKTQMGGVVDSLGRIESHQLNKKPVWNTGSVMAMLALVATILLGGATFLDTQLEHIRDDIVGIKADATIVEEFRHQVHYEIGVFKHTQKVHDEQWKHYDELMHKRDDKINEIENRQWGMSAD